MDYAIIVLVDDNPTTIFYNKDVLGDISPESEIVSYEDADTFINDYLTKYQNAGKRILLLLDINMPHKTGYEVLEELEEEAEKFDSIDIIMLTSSNLKSDYEKATRFSNIIGYIEKPLTIEKYNQTINGIF